MTVRVRFPETGICLQYNDGGYVERHDRFSDILEKKGGRWLAQVPNSCLIEWVRPCFVEVTIDLEMQRLQDGRVRETLRLARKRAARAKRQRSKK